MHVQSKRRGSEESGVSYQPPLHPLFMEGMVTPLEKAALFLMGQHPISFVKRNQGIHRYSEHPAVVTLHDLFHVGNDSIQPSWLQKLKRIFIYSAMIVFGEKSLHRPEIAERLCELSEMRLYDNRGSIELRWRDFLSDFAENLERIGEEKTWRPFLTAFIDFMGNSWQSPLFTAPAEVFLITT